MGITRKRKDKQIFLCVCGGVYFIALLNECEYARYSPTDNRNTQTDTILKKAKTIIFSSEC